MNASVTADRIQSLAKTIVEGVEPVRKHVLENLPMCFVLGKQDYAMRLIAALNPHNIHVHYLSTDKGIPNNQVNFVRGRTACLVVLNDENIKEDDFHGSQLYQALRNTVITVSSRAGVDPKTRILRSTYA